MSDIAIHVENLGKRYHIEALQQRRATTLRDALAGALRWRPGAHPAPAATELWALKDVSFNVQRGEVVGVIGRNGAGKSTLLKILSRITEPTTGQVEIRGRVGSLLEVGTGFHPELSGRENIFLNGAILGMKRAEILRRFDEIVDFAEVEKFLDTPVKHYSSGMYVRLAFAVAAHLETEILLVDEVLAVGDLAFQRKCLGKMDAVARSGKTVVLVSHNLPTVRGLCTSALLIGDGAVLKEGDTQAVVDHYVFGVMPNAVSGTPLSERLDRTGDGRIRLVGFHLESATGEKIPALQSGTDSVIVLHYCRASGASPKRVDVGLSFQDAQGQLLFVLYSSYTGRLFNDLPGDGSFRCLIADLPIAAGSYVLGARVSIGGDESDWPRDGIGQVEVLPGDFYHTGSAGFPGRAPLLLRGSWSVQPPAKDTHS